jgi:hypothetical protein
MAKETTYAGKLGDWNRLLGPLEENAAELIFLEGQRTKLTGLLGNAQEINKRQAALTAGRQEASKQLQGIVREGDRLANILRLSVKEHYGIDSEKLAEFGIQPFRGRPRKVKPETPVPTPTPLPDPQ